MIDRCIETRLLEACLRETKACFDSGGWTILGYPLMPGEAVNVPQINVFPVALSFQQGVGGVSNTPYGVMFRFYFPRELLTLVEGQRTYLDEIHKLRLWLYNGGTTPNRNGRLRDPDNPAGLSINSEITTFLTSPAAIDRMNGAIFIDAQASFGTIEDYLGHRAGT